MSMVILVYCIVTWVAPRSRLRNWLEVLVMPFCLPFAPLAMWIRRKTGIPVDFSCWFAIVALRFIPDILWRVYLLLVRVF